ncbi:MAG: MFS transporter, partial [Chloroflexota bacterium]
TRLVGPALGGAILGLAGLSSVVGSDAASFFFSAIMVLLIRTPSAIPAAAVLGDGVGPGRGANAAAGSPIAGVTSDHPVRRVWQEFADGVRLMGKNRLVRALLIAMGLSMVGQGIINVMLVPFVKDVLHGDALVLGWIASAQGVGGLLAGLFIGSVGARVAPRWLVAAGLALTGLLTVAVANSPWLWLVLLLVALIGLAVVSFAVGVQTILQVAVDDRYRGRVFGASNTIQQALMLVGMVLASGLAGLAGTVPLLDLAGAFTLLAGLTAMASLPAVGVRSPLPLGEG